MSEVKKYSRYSKRLKAIRKHVKQVDGVSVIGKQWIKMFLSKQEYKEFERKFRWRKLLSECICPTCGTVHLTHKKFKKYAYWWDIQKLIEGEQ